MDIFKESPMRLHEVIIGWLAIKHTSGTVVKYEHVYRGIVFNHGKLAWQIIIRNIKLCFAFPAIKKKEWAVFMFYTLYFPFRIPKRQPVLFIPFPGLWFLSTTELLIKTSFLRPFWKLKFTVDIMRRKGEKPVFNRVGSRQKQQKSQALPSNWKGMAIC